MGEAGLVAGGDLAGSLANAQVSEAGLTAGGDLSGPLSAALLGANTLGILEPGTAADDEIVDGSVDTEDVANNNLVANDLATDSVANLELANNAAADAEITDVTRTILIPASQLGPAALAEPAATNPDVGVIATSTAPAILFDQTTLEAVDLTIPIPADRVAGSDLDVQILWSGPNAAGGVGVTWHFQYAVVTPGSDLVNQALIDGNQGSPSTGVANRLNLFNFGTVDIPGASVANGDLLQLRLFRDASNIGGGIDDMTGDAALFAVGIAYTAAR